MKVKEAGDFFHGEERYNCAQAVLKTFQKEFSIEDSFITDAKKDGGGRAQDGLCGALYASHLIVPEQDFINTINQDFITLAKSLYCRDIRGNKTLPCIECVKLAAKCIQDHLQRNI